MSSDESLVLSAKMGIINITELPPVNSSNCVFSWPQRYGVEHSFIVPSGMSAISVTIQSILRLPNSSLKINIIYGDELYCDTPKTITYLVSGLIHVHRYTIDLTQTDDILRLFRELQEPESLNLLFVESCSNPSGFIMDFDSCLN